MMKEKKRILLIENLISYSTEFRMDIDLNNFVRKLCAASYDKSVSRYILLYIAFINEGREGRGAKVLQTDIQTDPPTKRVLEEHSLLKNYIFAHMSVKARGA